MTPIDLAMLAVVCACLAYIVGYVWRLADTLAVVGDPGGDDPNGPEDPTPPYDPMGPEADVDWDDFRFDLDLHILTMKENA